MITASERFEFKRKKIASESAKQKKHRAQVIAKRLGRAYPEIRVPLHHKNNYELLVATILSAQCTDEMVNKVTPDLFRRYPTPKDLSMAPQSEIEKLIRRLGLFRAKARALKSCAKELIEQYNGEVPSTMEALTQLPGVGRKTANVILGHAFAIPGIVVDTHCKRVSRRLGLTKSATPDRVETDLMKVLPPEEWTGFSHRLILHGRKICFARKPKCRECVLNDLCPSAEL